MNRRLFIWLVILVGISLPGIIAIHFFWVTNPLKMDDELFGKIVNEALNKAVQQLEMGQDVRTLEENLYDDASEWDEKRYLLNETTNEIKVPESDQKTYSNKIHNQLPLSGTDLGYQNWNAKRPIDTVRLKTILDEALKQTGINIPFKYAIFSGENMKKAVQRKLFKSKWYKVNLFPDDIFSRDIYLGVSFPSTSVYLNYGTFMRVLSILFTFLLIVSYILGISFVIRQKRLSDMKTDFINNMTHEFKTPITTIGIAADSILNEEIKKNEERVEFYSRMIRKENQRMNEQVERILQVARLDRKELYFKFQKVNVHELIEDAISEISIQVEKRGGRIITKLEAINPVVSTDPIHFENMVRNLLDNANKYSPESPDISISTVNDHKGLYMSVEDKGIGISKRVQTKIFDKFYRLTYGNLHNINGFGLGLSYIKAILKINRGTINVYSEPGKGSRFVVFIPF